MLLDCETKLFCDMTKQEAQEMLDWAEDVVLRGKVAHPDPKFVTWWLSSCGYDERQRLLVISTALPQRILLSLVRHLT